MVPKVVGSSPIFHPFISGNSSEFSLFLYLIRNEFVGKFVFLFLNVYFCMYLYGAKWQL